MRASYNSGVPGHVCYHCKQGVEEGEPHDCWTTTEAALTSDLSEDLREAWERLRETAVAFGEQRIYASHHSIMFSRRACYCFVRPKRQYLELCIFLPRALKASQVRQAMAASKSKVANLVRIVHRDEVESPITDWMRHAYEYSEQGARKSSRGTSRKKTSRARTTSRARSSGARKSSTRRTASTPKRRR
jgi:hypothetical protein